jgi:hypothetical protein
MTKRAVCIGINDYSARSDCATLPDARPDGESWAALLPDGFGFDAGGITLLTDAAANRQAVLNAVKSMLTQSAAGDVACLFFAGHGGRGKSGDGAWYESICCADAGGDITDTELNALAESLSPSTVNFTLVLDSCHSGGAFDVPASDAATRTVRWSADVIEDFASNCQSIVPHICLPRESALQGNVSISRDGSGALAMSINEDLNFADGAKATLLAACRYDQNSGGSGTHGYFTQALLDVINQSAMQVKHQDLLDRVRTQIVGYTTTQLPQLRGRPLRLEENFLNGWNYSV